MPCNTVQTTNVDISNLDPALVFAALTTMRLSPRKQGDQIFFNNGVYSVSDKKLDMRGSNIEERVATLKKAYSGEVVKATAKKFNWQVKQTKQYEYQVTKRSF